MKCNNDCLNCTYHDCIKDNRTYSPEYYRENKEKMQASTTRWKANHAEHVREYNRRYGRTEKRMEYQREYQRERYRRLKELRSCTSS